MRAYTLIALCLSTLCAQANTPASVWLKHITEYNDTTFGVSTMMPRDFLLCEGWTQAISYAPNKRWGCKQPAAQNSCYLYSNAMISRDRECLLLLPYLVFANGSKPVTDRSAFDLCRAQYDAEQRGAACCLSTGKPSGEVLTSLGGAEAKAWGNADSVYIANLPVSTPCMKRFTHCVGIYMAKSHHLPIYIKLLLTDEGYARRSHVLEQVKGCMTYAGNPQISNNQLASNTNRVLNINQWVIRALHHDSLGR